MTFDKTVYQPCGIEAFPNLAIADIQFVIIDSAIIQYLSVRSRFHRVEFREQELESKI